MVLLVSLALLPLALLPLAHLLLHVGPQPAVPAARGDHGRHELTLLHPLAHGVGAHTQPTRYLTGWDQRFVGSHADDARRRNRGNLGTVGMIG